MYKIVLAVAESELTSWPDVVLILGMMIIPIIAFYFFFKL